MHASSSALTATLRALHGDTDPHIIAPAFNNLQFARVLALAPNAHPVVGALGALAGGLPDVIPPAVRDSPALSTAIVSLIRMGAGNVVLPAWVKVAPVEWGVSHVATLIDAVQNKRCEPWAAAALIGPTNDTAALLTWSKDIAFAVRRWGQTTPDNPTAWMDHVSQTQRDRLLDTLRSHFDGVDHCLPWLPKPFAADIAGHIGSFHLPFALNAYADASPVARTRHADILAALMQRARTDNLVELTRLAVTSRMDEAWNTMVNLLREYPEYANLVVTAAPWDALRPDVQTVILSAANNSDMRAAIAFARGERSDLPAMTWRSAVAFFAAVTPKVWNALSMKMQRVWCTQLAAWHMPIAVRSLGPAPAFLARAYLNADVIAAVRRHAPNEASLRWTLLPMTIRDIPLIAVPDIIGTLPAPPDPVAFVQIACEEREMPPALRDWITAHPTPHAYGTAATILRAAEESDAIAARCAALAQALADWSREETDALLAALPKNARAMLRFNTNALARALAHPDRRDAFRQALDALDALPPAATLPSLLALETMVTSLDDDRRQQAGAALAQALRNHGRIFADIVGVLNDDARLAVLPRLDHPHDEAALDPLAVTDPLVAHHLAHALWAGDMPAALDALADSSLEKTLHLWRLLPDTIHSAVLSLGNTLIRNVAAPERADALVQALRGWNMDAPLALLALRMLIENDEARRARGAAILAQQPDMAASLLLLLREDLRAVLVRDPRIAVAGADLPPPSSPAPTPMLPRRRRRSR